MLNFLLPLSAALLWGIYYAVSEEGLKQISVPTLMLIGGAFSVIAALLLNNFGPEKISFEFVKSNKGLMLVATLLTVATLADLSSIYAVKNVSATFAAIGESIYPIFVPVFAYLIWQNFSITPMQIAGALIVAAGVAMFVLGEGSSETADATDIAQAKSKVVIEQSHIPEKVKMAAAE